MDVIKSDYRESLLEAIKQINTDDLTDNVEESITTIVEEQKVYFWIRLYLREEDLNIEIGDDIQIKYQPTYFEGDQKFLDETKSETLLTKFICYGKKGLDKDYNDQVTSYSSEDDKKVLCLMVDERVVNYGDGIDFIRTLFKTGRHYEYQLVRRDEILFINSRNGIVLDYFDCDF